MRFEVVIWAELPSFLPQTTVKPDRPVCWDGKWTCKTSYSVSGWGDRQLPTLASGSVAIQFLHFQSYWFTASFSAFANPPNRAHLHYRFAALHLFRVGSVPLDACSKRTEPTKALCGSQHMVTLHNDANKEEPTQT